MKIGYALIIMHKDSTIDHSMCFPVAAVLIIFSLQTLVLFAGDDSMILAKRDQVLANWRTMDLAELKRPENAPVLQELQKMSKKDPELAAREILIKIDDQEAIDDSLRDLRTNHPLTRPDAAGQIIRSGNARVILMLIPELNKVESAASIRMEDMKILPLSVQIASIIKGFIKRNDTFSPTVKAWANQLPTYGNGLREPIRAWWVLNHTAFEQGNYGAAVVPPNN